MLGFAYQATANEFLSTSETEVLGLLTQSFKFRQLEHQQISAWKYEIESLSVALRAFPLAHLFLEFEIPRIGKRADAIIILNGKILVLEYKVGAQQFDASSIDQVYDYALDLKNFHKGSHDLIIFPILIATDAADKIADFVIDSDNVAKPILTNSDHLHRVLERIQAHPSISTVDAIEWATSPYHPTPTIIEAAQTLYSQHTVEDISRYDAGAINLTLTSNRIFKIIEDAKINSKKVICLLTGVPGAGKTLAGLNIATRRQQKAEKEHAVFLSGNGPLVAVLREALVLDKLESNESLPIDERATRNEIQRDVKAFIQNIHHFRDAYLTDRNAPIEKVVVFDEAQRAWDQNKTSDFMRRERQLINFNMSEPKFLLSVMNRHQDWCVVICLIGGGQEINTGEAGINEWVMALSQSYRDWNIHCSDQLLSNDYTISEEARKLLSSLNLHLEPDLHLAVSLRSFRAENLSAFVAELIAGNIEAAKKIKEQLKGYPIYVTRDIQKARERLISLKRGNERIGLIASSNAIRLKPMGVFVKGTVNPVNWFLKNKHDIRSSNFLEDVATEFDVQGLELDWVGVCWDANFRFVDGHWKGFEFKGSKWQDVHQESKQRYIANSYRVLLTRGRQGLVIYVPQGDLLDHTRQSTYYDPVYKSLIECGIEPL